MPELCRFYGIIIKMYYNDHFPPHFHALYAEHEALIVIETLALFAGKLPPRAMGLVSEWASLHQEELMEAWNRARSSEPPGKIEPLD
ncbi:DUF4160 domain-containing protein [Acidobacteriota bacterium]